MADNQDKIWDYYQNSNDGHFVGSRARIKFLLSRVGKNAKVLNIGVGGGFLEKMAVDQGIDMYCLDPSEDSIEKLSAILGEKALVGYSQEIPFEENSFDVVVMSEVLEHLDTEVLNQTIKEVFRVLKPEGQFIGTVPSNEDLSANIVVSPSDGHVFHRWGHLQSFSENSLKSLLQTSFSKVRVSEKLFVNWETLNWKGKLIAALRKSLKSAGVGGSNRNLYFEAKS